MERQFFSGNTLEQAVLAAARYHGLDPEDVAYTTRDKKHGFVNIRRRVVIEVDPNAPERTEELEELDALEEDSRGQATSTEWIGAGHDAADGYRNGRRDGGRREHNSWQGEEVAWVGDEEGNETIAVDGAIEELNKLIGIELTSSVQRAERGFDIEFSGEDAGLLRKNRGNGLDAIEHLLPRLIRGLNGYGVPCRVDSEGFRVTREQELQLLARDVARDVSREGEERRLEPMNPADRRQVHMALAEDPAVRTESEGEGFLKRVRIVPV